MTQLALRDIPVDPNPNCRKESERARGRRAYAKHKAKRIAGVIDWRRQNPDKVREYYARHWAKHGERTRIERKERRATAHALDPKGAWWTETLKAACCRAKKKGIPFDRSATRVELPDVCPVLGLELKYYSKRGVHGPDSPSLDRIVPERGYVTGNLRVISNRANTLRNNATLNEMRRIVADMETIGNR